MDQAITRAAGATQIASPLPAATARRQWTLLLTSANHGVVGPLGSTFTHAGERFERVDVVEVPAAAGAPVDQVNLQIVRSAAPARPVGEFQGYIDGEPAVTWFDRTRMPNVGEKLYAGAAPAAGGVQALTEKQIDGAWDRVPSTFTRGQGEKEWNREDRHAPAAQPEGEAPQAVVPAGWVLVPKRATHHMAWEIMLAHRPSGDSLSLAEDAWTRAVKAAPHAPAAQHAEAPPAVPVKPWREAFRDQYPNYPQVELPWETKFNWAELEIAQLRAAPAAQHAENGAQASSLTTVPCPCVAANRTAVCDDCDGQGRLIVDKHDLADHLAAQSQGAQEPIGYIGAGAVETLSGKVSCKTHVMAESGWPCNVPVYLAAPAAQHAESGAPRIRAVMRADAPLVQAHRAQQAAAPGALDASKAVYWFGCLEKCARLLELADDEPIPSGVVAAVERLIADRAAPSNPGTPEAPAKLPRLYRFDCYVGKTKMAAGVGVHATSMEEAEQKARKLADKDETIEFESNRPCHATRKCGICAAYERAAQLDGGQGEGA